MKEVKFSIGDTDFILTNTSMEWYGPRTGISHLALSEISDERVEVIARFMEKAAAAEREACTEFAERILLQHTYNLQGMTGDEPEYEENADAQDRLWKRAERQDFSKRVSVAAYRLEEAAREACARGEE